MAYENLKAAIKQAIKNNNNQEITGDLLQNTLLSIVDTACVSLGTLITKLNNDNPFPTASGQVLTYDGSNFDWKGSNADFTFKSVTANTFNVINSIQLSDSISLSRNGTDVYLVDDTRNSSIYLDGYNETYFIDSRGNAFFNYLDCDSLSFSGASNFEIVDADDYSFTIRFEYGGRTYKFTPSNVAVIS